MSKSMLKKALIFLALTIALITAVSVVTFAEGETKAQSDNMVYVTSYGTFTVSDAYADVEAYPWVSFNADTGACLYGSKVFAQNNGSILSHTNTGYSVPNIIIILRRDVSVTESSQWHNCVWNVGRNMVIDLQGHTLTMAYGMSPLFSAEEKTSGLVKYTFQNGNIVAVTYGGKNGDDMAAYKTFILNYNNFAVTVKYEVNGQTKIYTIPANDYVVVVH